uniref:DUF4806 domain-containing protein n=1 Tax=Anopheles culicifacies TaxID=139723 RepID=A0A182LYD5_9DIPT
MKMTCSTTASTDGCSTSQTEHPQSSESTETVVANTNDAVPSKEPSIADVLNILTTLSENFKDLQARTESIEKEVTSISNRLTRVEQTVGISSATFEQRPGNEAHPRFEFTAVRNEQECIELDTKLGTDLEYCGKFKSWLENQIHADDPEKRMLIAMDLVFDRIFLPKCRWSGKGASVRVGKFRIKDRIHILKLFAKVGSNKNLPHAKEKMNQLNTSCP